MTINFASLDEKEMVAILNEGTNLMNNLQEFFENNENVTVISNYLKLVSLFPSLKLTGSAENHKFRPESFQQIYADHPPTETRILPPPALAGNPIHF